MVALEGSIIRSVWGEGARTADHRSLVRLPPMVQRGAGNSLVLLHTASSREHPSAAPPPNRSAGGVAGSLGWEL